MVPFSSPHTQCATASYKAAVAAPAVNSGKLQNSQHRDRKIRSPIRPTFFHNQLFGSNTARPPFPLNQAFFEVYGIVSHFPHLVTRSF